MKIIQFDQSILDAAEDLTVYMNDDLNYSKVAYKTKQNPSDGWAVPFVTGHRYRVHWGDIGLDFDRMRFDLST